MTTSKPFSSPISEARNKPPVILDLTVMAALAGQCAPTVAAETLLSVVHAESRFDPYAIGINAKGVKAPKARDRASAAALARSLIGRGYNIDLGLGQINSGNLQWLGLSVDDAFDPCANLAAAARVLSSNYQSVARSTPTTGAAIATAMSMYNTGNRWRGFGNGYVARVYASSDLVIPALRRGKVAVGAEPPTRQQSVATMRTWAQTSPAAQVIWDTSARAQSAAMMVFGGTSNTSPKGRSE